MKMDENFPPPWSWHPIKRNNHQNYAIRLCYVCADLCRKNERLCWFGVWDIKHSFFDRVTSLSTACCPNRSKPAQFVCARFVPLNQTLYLFSFRRYNQNIFGGRDVTLHPSSSKSHKTGVIRLCSICAGLCCWNERQIYFSFLEITKTILGSDVILHPMASKSLQTGAINFEIWS